MTRWTTPIAVLWLLIVISCGGGANTGAPQRVGSVREYRRRPNASIECRGPAKLSSAAVEGRFDELRASCTQGESSSCFALANQKAPIADVDFGRTKLGDICSSDRKASARWPNDFGIGHDRTCSCGRYGIILLSDPKQRFDHEGLALVDEACVHGWLEACDDAQLLSEICVRQDMPVCKELRAQGRVAKPGPDDERVATTLPSELARCFVIDAIEPCKPTELRSCRSDIDVGATYCFEQSRISTLSTRTRGASAAAPAQPQQWDQVKTDWSGFPGVTSYWSRSGIPLRVENGIVFYAHARLKRAPPAADREARALPHVEEVCSRVRRCVAVVGRLKDPRGSTRPRSSNLPDIELDGEGGSGSIADLDRRETSMIDCLDEARAARAAVARFSPNQPNECLERSITRSSGVAD